jgi:hypothetical protein
VYTPRTSSSVAVEVPVHSVQQDVYGARLFVRERVHELGPEFVIVDGGDASGACLGDSGGPLLDVGQAGMAQLLGVLSFGAASCTGVDHYTRTDRVRDWIGETLAAAARDPCGDISHEGACEAGNAVFCEAGEPRSIDCGRDTRCGYSLARAGFRCVPAVDDACMGLGSSGACERDVLVSCAHGAVRKRDCAACGEHCRRTRDGQAVCSE